ncbi:UNVERIFIED_ORG: HEAT repeat protein [Pantoea agglomerans]|uniref:HEAT repeat domain-containing protein n=1 Tax=Enterobacter bugandensis TaxID=881260 RepID=UPI0021131DED|nr:HEAT repeat domain-containing protein [Enterobacter hormaechei]MDU4341974.1 HEAT repeat domain-containing protein [Enterobacter hormaechei]HCM9192732.1 HEAT repeat domain-containing protein [Enterobacter cloacae subsp. dissolvens]
MDAVVIRLLAMTEDAYNDVRIAAIEGLGESGVNDQKVIERLLALTDDAYNDVRVAAAKALGRLYRAK